MRRAIQTLRLLAGAARSTDAPDSWHGSYQEANDPPHTEALRERTSCAAGSGFEQEFHQVELVGRRSGIWFVSEDPFEGSPAHLVHRRIAFLVVPGGTYGLFKGPRLTAFPFEFVTSETLAK